MSVVVLMQDGESPFWAAARGGHLVVVRLLEEKGVEVDRANNVRRRGAGGDVRRGCTLSIHVYINSTQRRTAVLRIYDQTHGRMVIQHCMCLLAVSADTDNRILHQGSA